MTRALLIGIVGDLMIIFFLFPAYKEIMDTILGVVESVINTPLTPGENLILYSIPIVWVIASLIHISWRIYKSRSRGGVRF